MKLEWCMQDGEPTQYMLPVRHWLHENFTNRWISQIGTVEWAPRPPDLNPMDFSIWGYLKP